MAEMILMKVWMYIPKEAFWRNAGKPFYIMALRSHKISGGRAEIDIASVWHLLRKYSCQSVPGLWHFQSFRKPDEGCSSFASGYPAGFGNLHPSAVLV